MFELIACRQPRERLRLPDDQHAVSGDGSSHVLENALLIACLEIDQHVAQHDEIERFADHIGIIKNGSMLIEGATQDLLQRYRLLDATSSNRFTGAAHLKVQQCDGTRLRLLCDSKGISIASLSELGLKEVVEVPITLEDLFIALMK